MPDALSSLYASLSRIQDPTIRDVMRQHADAIAATIAQTTAIKSIKPPAQLTLAEIKAALQGNGKFPLVLTGLPGLPPGTLSGLHAARPTATDQPLGTMYIETDRLSLYVIETVSSANAWVFVAGLYSSTFSARPTDLTANDAGFLFSASDQSNVVWRWSGTSFIYWYGKNSRTQAQLAALAALLGVNDAGYIVPVSDYHHTLVWSGSAWTFQEGDSSGYVLIGQPDGSAPTGGLWGACDGTAYNVLQGDGTLVSKTTQNLTGNVFIKGATATAAQRAADRAKWEATAKTDDESAHTHDIVNNINVTLGAGANNAAAAQTSTAGTAHHHTLSDANAQLKVFNETNGGLPLSIQVCFWIRR